MVTSSKVSGGFITSPRLSLIPARISALCSKKVEKHCCGLYFCVFSLLFTLASCFCLSRKGYLLFGQPIADSPLASQQPISTLTTLPLSGACHVTTTGTSWCRCSESFLHHFPEELQRQPAQQWSFRKSELFLSYYCFQLSLSLHLCTLI